MGIKLFNQYLIQKLTNAEILAIANPPIGVWFYDTTNNFMMYYNGASWATV